MDYVPNNFKSLSELFDCTLTDLKGSIPLWDDLVIKITRLHAAIRGVVQANSSFLESFQKIADLATNSSALASKDIGTSLTRLSLRQRSLHLKMKTMNENMVCRIIDPMQQRLDEWKRSNLQLDKDRIKETRRAKSDLKKASEEKNRLQKKALKRGSMKGLGSLQMQVEVALKEAADKYQALENIEYECVRRVVIEERSRFCYFVNCLMPVLECQINMFSEMQTLEEIKTNLGFLVENSNSLTQSSEDLIRSIIRPLTLSSVDAVVAASIAYSTTPPPSTDTGSSDGSLISSRKSSVLSINSEASSSHSGGANNIMIHRRSRSESPTNILHEQESDDIFIDDGNCEKTDIELMPQDPAYAALYQVQNVENTNEITNFRDYDSVTLKRPKDGNRAVQNEDELLLLSNLTVQPDTPNVNANYSALYQLHHPIIHLPGNRKFSASSNRNGDMYPEYNTIHSSSPSSQPRRMTVPQLPHVLYQAPAYATIKHQSKGNSIQQPGGTHLHQIDECHLPPNPNEDQLMNHSLDLTDSDMPMPPPPVDQESQICTNNLNLGHSAMTNINIGPPVPPPPPPPPCVPPPISQIKAQIRPFQYNNNNNINNSSVAQSPQHNSPNMFSNSLSRPCNNVPQTVPNMFSNCNNLTSKNIPVSSDPMGPTINQNNFNRSSINSVPPPPAPPPPPPPVPIQNIFPMRR